MEVDLIMPCLNEVNSIDRALQSVVNQTRVPDHIYVADGGSTDGTLDKLAEWKKKIPLTVIHNEDVRQAPGLNQCIRRSGAPLLARMDSHSVWSENYLETLLEILRDDTDIGAAGARVELIPKANSVQNDIWGIMIHPLGTGAPSYRTEESSRTVPSLQCPVYRREAIEEAGMFPGNLPWAEDDELHRRIRGKGYELTLCTEARLYYAPRNQIKGFIRQFHNYGRGRGQLGRLGHYPDKRHKKIDRFLLVWTLGLWWNPVGWGFLLIYLLTLIPLTIQLMLDQRCTPRVFVLFPLAHSSYWLGWLRERFEPATVTNSNEEPGKEKENLTNVDS